MKMKNKGICFLMTVFVLCTLLCVSAAAETGIILREWRMEPKANGGDVTYLDMVTSAWNTTGDDPLKGGNYENYVIVDKKCNNTLGVDGGAALSFRMTSFNNAKKFIAIADTAALATKPGYTYFKSAMIKLNPEHTDKSNKQKKIYPVREADGKGFISTSDKFKETLDSYDGSTEIPFYDWLAKNPATPKYDINTENWTRVTEAVYRDASQAASKERSGWVVWGKDWSTLQWTGNWEFLIDDYVLLEVPNSALKSKVYPVVYGGSIDKTGEVEVGTALTASYSDIYDVNPMAAPTAAYVWQRSADGTAYTDIEGANGASYTVTDADKGCYIRAKVTAVSVPEDGEGQKLAAVSSAPSYSEAVVCPASAALVTVSVTCGEGGSATVNGKASDDVATGTECAVEITPDDGYQVKSVKVNGADYPAGSDSFNITVNENTEISIAFIEKKSVAGISGSGSQSIVYQNNYKPSGSDKTYVSFVAYYKISVPKDWTVAEYGMNLNGLKLEGKGMSGDYMFGIRAFGDALVKGESYPGYGYVKFEGDDTVYTQEQTVSVPNE